MNRINKELDIPLYLQIADRLRNDIKTGVIRPGDKLASEHELMKRYNVSRMTVRNAFSELVTEGLVEKHHGKGSFCRGLPEKKNIDVLLNMSDHYFMSYYLQSISSVLEGRNAKLIAGDTQDSNGEIVKRLAAIARRGSDGVIVQGCPKDDWNEAAFTLALRELEAQKIPVMVIDYVYPVEKLCCAAMDETGIGALAARHFFQKGHRKAAAVWIPGDGLSRKRLEGFRQVLPDTAAIAYDQGIQKGLLDAIGAGVTALFCYNDVIAQKCMDFLREENIGVPEALSVISVDDTILAGVYGITSVAHAKNRIGEYAANQIFTPEPQSRIFEPVLVERQSVKALR